MLMLNNRILNSRFLVSTYFSIRNLITTRCLAQSYNFAKLNSKSFIQISGEESADFLQGLITNDVRHLTPDKSTSVHLPCIYSFMLNNTGRIIADLFVYKFSHEDNLILLEVDERIRSSLSQLFKRYRIRRKIKINANDQFCSWIIFPEVSENIENNQVIVDDWSSKIIISNDPRNYHFGYKMLTTQDSINSDELLNLLIKSNERLSDLKLTKVDENKYRSFRYQYGIGEGPVDFPPENSFPLEANGDILNGISFHKGCYVGQELTTRTYHTGVIRKRIMPLKIVTNSINEHLDNLSTQNVIDSHGKTIGRFRSNFHHQGLAVLKFSGLTSDTIVKLSLSGHRIRIWQPFWWPESIVEQSCKLDRMMETPRW